ncbi:beta-galactosidase-like protein [Motilibacter peucedani]|uniref:Beta-galactosidase-like protein n=1 Tax=Motilibacter peucedani TaxID=598650 RepID=A0A420XPG6_9ACTN|nr:endo-1,4-beta-xylanase [Motilibacter peucedani]RKS74088.1 beta-galactosidase-like protein [Motilibacter peucedani]
MRLPRPRLTLPRLPAAPAGLVRLRPRMPARRSTRAAAAAGVAVLLAAGTVVAVSVVDGEPHGASAASIATFSQTPGWMVDPSTGPLAGGSALPSYAAPTAPPVAAPPPTIPPVSVVPPVTVPLPTPSRPVVPPASTPTPPTTPASSPTPTAPAQSDVTPPHAPTSVPASLFGLTVNGYGSGAAVDAPYGAVRLWDTQVTWQDLEPERGTFDWARLDAQVAAANKARARVMLVLGQTPQWAADKVAVTTPPSQLPTGSSPPKKLSDWTAYVKAVVTRYKGRIADYEVWNEPNAKNFWLGSQGDLIPLAKSAYTTIKAVDPGATVTTPSFVVRRPAQQGELTRYLAADGAKWADVVNLHLYPDADQGPEAMAPLLDQVKTRLAAFGVEKPIWNTEVNYLLPTGGAAAPAPLSADDAAAWVARTYLITAHLGVGRAYWYAWDNHVLGVPLTESDGTTPNAAGKAYDRIHTWLQGSGFRGCSVDNEGTWTCWVATGRVVWNPGAGSKPVDYAAPWGTKAAVALSGASTPTRHGQVVKIGTSPILVKTR